VALCLKNTILESSCAIKLACESLHSSVGRVLLFKVEGDGKVLPHTALNGCGPDQLVIPIQELPRIGLDAFSANEGAGLEIELVG
jgi:hypothetical protein